MLELSAASAVAWLRGFLLHALAWLSATRTALTPSSSSPAAWASQRAHQRALEYAHPQIDIPWTHAALAIMTATTIVLLIARWIGEQTHMPYSRVCVLACNVPSCSHAVHAVVRIVQIGVGQPPRLV